MKIEKVESISRYHVLLSADEARFLRDVFNAIGGDASITRRGLSDQMNSALREAGVSSALDENADDNMTGSIRCT